MPPVASADLPESLLERFAAADDAGCVIRFLDFVKPVTTRSPGRGAGNSMVG